MSIPKSIAWILVPLLAIACGQVKQNAVFNNLNEPSESEKVFFTADEIYSDALTSDAWNTRASAQCISVKNRTEAAYKGTHGMHVTWNRQGPGCPWLGLGFGWDNWTGKDLSQIKNTGAIEFYVRMVEGERGNLPWAIGLEDFSGGQAWLGMSTNAVKAEKIGTNWTRIELPLSEFNWLEQNADASNIKQIIFNMEADGEIYMDEVRIVPYKGGFRKRAYVDFVPNQNFDASLDKSSYVWNTQANQLGANKIYLAVIGSYLHIAGEVIDKTPLQNTKSEGNVYDGDAFEIAFSTDFEANPRRPRLLSSDQHIGISMGKSHEIWNWRKKVKLQKAEVLTQEIPDGYRFAVKIPLEELEITGFIEGKLYGLEMAIDQGDANKRSNQIRWNDAANAGFNESPSRWGEMMFVEKAILN